MFRPKHHPCSVLGVIHVRFQASSIVRVWSYASSMFGPKIFANTRIKMVVCYRQNHQPYHKWIYAFRLDVSVHIRQYQHANENIYMIRGVTVVVQINHVTCKTEENPTNAIQLYNTMDLLPDTQKFRDAHAPGMTGTFSPPPRDSDPDMRHGTCVTNVPWCIPVSPWSRWWGKLSRHSRCIRNPQFYVSGKKPMLVWNYSRFPL